MNNFDIIFNNLKTNGIDCDIKKKDQYGNLVSIKENEIESLGTKSIIASTAGLIKNLSKDEKMSWAIETKLEANDLFRKKLYQEAMMKYMEALTATDFGNNEKNIRDNSNEIDSQASIANIINHGNINELVIPVLCNLAACCIHLKEWNKTISFCEQATLLRSNCSKAYLRKGIGYLNTDEYELALHCFQLSHKNANEWNTYISTTGNNNDNKVDFINSDEILKCSKLQELSLIDFKRLPNLITKARNGIKIQKEILLKQKESLRNAFNKYNITPLNNDKNNTRSDDRNDDTSSNNINDTANNNNLQIINSNTTIAINNNHSKNDKPNINIVFTTNPNNNSHNSHNKAINIDITHKIPQEPNTLKQPVDNRILTNNNIINSIQEVEDIVATMSYYEIFNYVFRFIYDITKQLFSSHKITNS